MNGNNHIQFMNPIYQGQLPHKKFNQRNPNPVSPDITWSLNLPQPAEQTSCLKDSFEFDCFKDDNLRVHEQERKPRLERANMSLFRKQKRNKWMDALNEELDVEPHSIQFHAIKQQKINPTSNTLANSAKNITILNHRSVSQGLKRQTNPSLPAKCQKNGKATVSSLKFRRKKLQTSLDRYSQQKKQQSPQKHMKFQITAKPMIERTDAKIRRKTKEELKRLYSPSRIFHKATKSSREFLETSEQTSAFKAWQLLDEMPHEFEEYTQELFSCETLDLRPAIKSPQRSCLSRRK